MLRRGITLALCSLLIVALAACSGGDSKKQQAAASPSASVTPQVTITWSFWGDPWEEAINRRVARAFEREHPEIHVQIEHHPWNQYFDWLKDQWQSGQSPDVMFLNYIPSYVRLGELEPLDAFTARDDIALGDFHPALLDSFRVDSVLYGLPRDNDTKVIYYNRDQFAQAGLPIPGPGWTWDDLRNDALALSRAGAPAGRYAFGFEPDFWWLVWVWQNGGDVLDDPVRPTAVRLDSPQSIAALDFLQRLIHVDKVTPPPSQLNTDDMAELFRDGRLAMMLGNHALVPVFTEQSNLSWDVAPLPRSVERANVAGGAGYVISRRSLHKDAAWELVKFLTGRRGEAIFAESGIITPARRSVREDNIFLRQQSYHADVFLSETELGRPVPNFRGATDMDTLINASLAPLWRGERDAASIVQELTPKLQQIIETVK